VKRGTRRAQTERIVTRRMRQWKAMSNAPRVPGKGKKKSHLDCGKPGCRVCGSPIKGAERVKASDRRRMHLEDNGGAS